MIDNAKINALIQKYGKVAAGRKVNYQPVRLEQHELLSTYRTEEDRLLTGRTEAPIADSFKKRKPISHVPKATQLGSTHSHLKRPIAHEVPQLQTSDIRMKADKKHATDVQTSRPTVTTKTAKPVKKKSVVAPVKKDRQSKLMRLLEPTKPLRQKKSQSLTPEKSARNRKSSGANFLKKQFERIDKRLEDYRIQTNESLQGTGNSNGMPRKDPDRQTLPPRLSLNKLKPATRNQRATTMRSVDRPRSSTYRSTARSINGKSKPNQHDDSGSFRKKPKHPRRSTKATTTRPKKQKTFESTDVPPTKHTRRRIVTEIETEYTEDKKSFFDEEAYKRLIMHQSVEQQSEDRQHQQEYIENQAAQIIQRAWRVYIRRKNLKQLRDFRKKLHDDLLVKTPRGNQPVSNSQYPGPKQNALRIECDSEPSSNSSVRKLHSPINDEIFRTDRVDAEKDREIELERFRISEHEKWDRMYRDLMQIQASLGDNEIKKQLPMFIQMCQQNRREVQNIELTVRSRQQSSNDQQQDRRAHDHTMSNASDSDFEHRKKQYDDAPLNLKLSRRKKSVDEGSQKSIQRQISSKKLVDEVQNFCYNDQLPTRPYESPQHLVEEHEQRQIYSTVQKISTSDYLSDIKSESRFKKKLEFAESEDLPPTNIVSEMKPEKSDDNFHEFLELIKVDTFFQKRPDLGGVVEWIMEFLCSQFAGELFNSKQILHRLLTTRDQFSINVREEADLQQTSPSLIDGQPDIPIQCNGTFVLALIRLFMLEIECTNLLTLENHLENFNQQISVPFGEAPITMLKFFRSSPEEDQVESLNGGINKYRTILEVQTFIEFEPVLKQRLLVQSTVSQYFFNHCVFDCLNELLDRFRPFGMKGRPPLCSNLEFKVQPFHDIVEGLTKAFKLITGMEVGRIVNQNADMEEVSRYIEQSFRRLDACGIEQTSHEWKDNSDLEFEVIFDLSVGVTQQLLLEALLQMRCLL